MAKIKAAEGRLDKFAKADTRCPVTKEQFRAGAKPLMVTVGDRQLVASPKEFSTGSFGWYAGEKIVVQIDGVPVKVQVGLNLTVVGSKNGSN